MAIPQFSNVASKSGEIEKSGFLIPTYTVDTSTATPQVGRNTIVNAERRSYFNYDTSSIPSNAIIVKVEFYHAVDSVTASNPPSDWQTAFYIGTFIGLALDSRDWNGGTLAVTENWQNPDNPVGKWIDLGSVGVSNLNKSGDTDIAVRDASLYSGTAIYDTNLKKSNCKLRVTWYYEGEREGEFEVCEFDPKIIKIG
jgi:hypothetical protein